MAGVGKVVRSVIRSDGTLGPLVGARVYPVDAIPQNAALPFIAYEVTGNVPDRDMTGEIGGYTVAVDLTIADQSYEAVNEILTRLPVTFNAIDGQTIEGVAIAVAGVEDVGDEINGPIDINGRRAFEGSATVAIYHGS